MPGGSPNARRRRDTGFGVRSRLRRPRRTTLAHATDLLAEAVEREVAAEALSRYAERPQLTITWREVPQGPTADVPRRGEVRSLHEVHSRSGSGRLVVLGEPGAGKSTAAFEYARHVLEGRAGDDAVPVVMALARWNGGAHRLEDWIADTVVAAHPHLRRWRVGRVGAVRALVDAGLVVPVLDGFDEVAPDSRAGLLGLIDGLPFPVVLTSRSDEFTDVLRGGRLDAVVVELEPLTAAAVREYLEALLNPRSRRWQAVADEVTRDPDGPVARLLRSPLGIDLVLTSYFADEVDRRPAPDEESAEPNLVDVLIDAALDGTLRSAGRDTVRLLGRLAHQLDRAGADDIAWWRFHLAVPTLVLHVVALATGLVGGIGAGLLVGDRGGPLAGIGVGLLVTIALMLAPWASAESTGPPVRRIRLAWHKLTVLQGAGVTTALLATTPAWVTVVGVTNLGVSAVLALRADETPGGPLVSLARDRAVALGRGALSGWAALLLLSWSGATPGNPATWAVVAAVAAAGLSPAAYHRYAVARLVLWSDGVWRWNPLAFLDNAHRAGLLRVVDDAYRFRHVVVRDRLAVRHAREEASSPLGRVAERILALREALLDVAFERADVAAAVDSATVPRLRSEVGVLFEGAVEAMATATAGARERFDASKERYARRVGVSPLWAATYQLRRFGSALIATAVWSCALVVTTLPQPVVRLSALAAGVVLVLAQVLRVGREVLREGTADRASGVPARFLAGTPRFLHRHVRLRQALRAVGVHGGAGGLLVTVAADLLPPDDFDLVPMSTAAAGVVLVMIWRVSSRLRDRAIALGHDDPARWPARHELPRAAAARDDADRAYAEWSRALVEHGVLPLVASRLEILVQRSYSVELPAASVGKLGDITESTQFVPTGTSARLSRMLATMTSGAIGVSGARGVGKSTLLRTFGDQRFGAARDDLALVVYAPTDYDSRDFLVHLFARVCESVLPQGQATPSRTTTGRRGWAVASLMALGAILAVAGFRRPVVVDALAWTRHHALEVVGWSGAACLALPPVWWAWTRLRRRRRDRTEDGTAENIARSHLAALRYVETTTRTKTAAVKSPFGVEVGGSRSRQHAALARTHPELVGEFRGFLDFLGLRQRSRADARIVVCIDELDKIGSAEETERFINDIKSVFGVEGCFFLVAVSEDALASFAQRAFTVRTTFDSAFDAVIRVDRFTLADTRRLLVHRVLRLPEPFVWLCHALSGGLPRDLNRTVRQMYDIRAARQVHTLPEISAGLIAQDLTTAVEVQVLRLRDRTDEPAVDLRRWVARAARLPLTSPALQGHRDAFRAVTTDDELALVHGQFSAYLHYAATLVRAFHEDVDLTIAQLEGADDKADVMHELAEARARLSVDPVLSVAHVDAFRDAVPLLGRRTT